MNNNVNVGGQVQRFFMGIILPIAPLFIWYFIFTKPFETIGWVFITVAFCAIPLVFINLIIERLQTHNTFLFFVFSVLVLLGYMCLTLSTAYLIVFFWCIVPGCLITIPILRWHYLHGKNKEEFIEVDYFNI
ncbi:MAG: hypothetical protein IK065_03460 [Neisseriaceae bacterium]|nr:hypothetical protein [Neisseriaceae bacterium]